MTDAIKPIQPLSFSESRKNPEKSSTTTTSSYGGFSFFSILLLKLQKIEDFPSSSKKIFGQALTVRCWEVPFHFPPRLVDLWIEIKTFPLFTGDHCLVKIGFIDHIIMDTLDKPAKEKKIQKKNEETENQA